jgi:hypothetical protein
LGLNTDKVHGDDTDFVVPNIYFEKWEETSLQVTEVEFEAGEAIAHSGFESR